MINDSTYDKDALWVEYLKWANIYIMFMHLYVFASRYADYVPLSLLWLVIYIVFAAIRPNQTLQKIPARPVTLKKYLMEELFENTDETSLALSAGMKKGNTYRLFS